MKARQKLAYNIVNENFKKYKNNSDFLEKNQMFLQVQG